MSAYEEELLEELGSYADDPLGFVLWAFPWGEENTELARYKEPHPWQMDYFEQLGDNLRKGEPVLNAASSGHGTGKSAKMGMVSWWAMGTVPGTRGVITANTEGQLKTKTWVEISKWGRLFIARQFFRIDATAIFARDPDLAREWRLDLIPWSEQNPQAFAGLHNAGKRVFVGYDEASAISDIIWETTEGALTDEDTQIIWDVQGNPTQDTGRFRECFPGGKFNHRWNCFEINSEDVPGVNKNQLRKWEQDHGRDSDFYRVRVLGKFPKAGASTFIGRDLAKAATERVPDPDNPYPLVLGVDPGRYGPDPTVVYPRRGMDARSYPVTVAYGLSNVECAQLVRRLRLDYDADFIGIDANGLGSGVFDILEAWGEPVTPINPGERPQGTFAAEPTLRCANRRTELYATLRHHLPRLSIHDKIPGYEQNLSDELSYPKYDYDRLDRLMLEAKASMAKRGIKSTNIADALSYTFFMHFEPRDPYDVMGLRRMKDFDYNPFDESRF